MKTKLSWFQYLILAHFMLFNLLKEYSVNREWTGSLGYAMGSGLFIFLIIWLFNKYAVPKIKIKNKVIIKSWLIIRVIITLYIIYLWFLLIAGFLGWFGINQIKTEESESVFLTEKEKIKKEFYSSNITSRKEKSKKALEYLNAIRLERNLPKLTWDDNLYDFWLPEFGGVPKQDIIVEVDFHKYFDKLGMYLRTVKWSKRIYDTNDPIESVDIWIQDTEEDFLWVNKTPYYGTIACTKSSCAFLGYWVESKNESISLLENKAVKEETIYKLVKVIEGHETIGEYNITFIPFIGTIPSNMENYDVKNINFTEERDYLVNWSVNKFNENLIIEIVPSYTEFMFANRGTGYMIYSECKSIEGKGSCKVGIHAGLLIYNRKLSPININYTIYVFK